MRAWNDRARARRSPREGIPAVSLEPERAIAELEAGLAQHPDHPTMLYHLACFESRAGLAAAALEHLQRAVDLDGQLRAWARDDEDFSGLRDDPRFVSAIAGEPDADGPSS